MTTDKDKDITQPQLTTDAAETTPAVTDKAKEARAIPTGSQEEAAAPDNAQEAKPTLQEVIKEQATEEDAPFANNMSFSKILGGDILSTSAVRRQIWLFLLIGVFVLIYISNRYSCQKSLIEIDKLQRDLLDAKYRALSSSSQLTEKSRESNVLELLQSNKDSLLHIATQPPFIINVPEH